MNVANTLAYYYMVTITAVKCILQAWGQCYKTFYGRKLRLFIISYSVCPWKALPAQSNVCGRGHEPTLEWSVRRCFTVVGAGLTRNHQARLERLARDKCSSLLLYSHNYGRRRLCSTGPDSAKFGKCRGENIPKGSWTKSTSLYFLRNLRMGPVSWIVKFCQAGKAYQV